MEDDAPRVFTGRLELVAATAALARAAAGSAEALGRLLECEVPRGWPPELMKDHEADWAQQLEDDPTLAGWSAWYIVQVKPAVLVGSIGLSGRPDADGCVECGYALLPKYQRKGYATEAMGGLIDWAFSQEGVRRIRAHTYRHLTASIRVLEKNGLSHVGDGDEPETLRFELARP
ncbi:MAG: GNAT family N-acetyltransferase [Polyangia bacterium]